MLVAPELIPVIMFILAREFNPKSPDFNSTIQQVLGTMQVVLPSSAGIALAATMPVHSGLLRNAAARDQADMLREARIIQ